MPDDSIASARREEAIERKREAELNEIDQIMKPLVEPLAALKAAAVELKTRSKMVPYLSAETDTRDEADYLLNAIEQARGTILRAVKDAVEV